MIYFLYTLTTVPSSLRMMFTPCLVVSVRTPPTVYISSEYLPCASTLLIPVKAELVTPTNASSP